MRKLRPAFVVTGALSLVGCEQRVLVNPPATGVSAPPTAPPTGPAATSAPSASAELVASAEPVATAGPSATAQVAPSRLPIRDADGQIVFYNRGKCYVQRPKPGKPPQPLMSGERWVEDKPVDCPPEFRDPALSALSPGMYIVQDARTGDCYEVASFGNPPPPRQKVECPSFAKKRP
jgi:hypothetical protein